MRKFRIISLFMVVVNFVIMFGGKTDKAFAAELETLSSIVENIDLYEDNLNTSYTTEDEELTVTYSTSGDVLTVYVKDHVNNTESTVTRNLVTNQVISDGEEVYISVIQPRAATRVNFNVTPTSVANAIALILSIPAIIATMGTAGLSLASFGSGLKLLAEYVGLATFFSSYVTSPTYNGYFTFSQEMRTINTTPEYRNINRIAYARVNQNPYKTYNYGNSAWFYTTRPY